jgi:steroid delta-isomerase-like uncharacterized protein
MRTHVVLPWIAVALLLVGCTCPPDAGIEANKEIARQFVAAYNSGDFDRLDELMMDDMVRHTRSAVEVHSLEEFKADLRQIAEAFPDAREEIQMIVAEADKVVVYGIWTATQEAAYGPFPASGKETVVPFFYLFRMEGGKIAEFWTEWDNLNLLMQLGHYPPTPET